MKVKLGCQPLTWKSEFETAAREIAAIGYSGVEAPVGGYLERLDELKKLLTDNNLQCCSTYCSGAFENLDERPKITERIVEIAGALSELGADKIILAPGGRGTHPLDKNGNIREDILERFADGATECARQCYEKYGVKSVLHNHAWTLIESPHEVDTFMELTDPIFVLAGFDVAQLAYGGYEPAEAFRKWKGRIGYVHIKDNHPSLLTSMPVKEKNALRDGHKDKTPKFHVFAGLGQGALGDAGLDAVLNVLREIDYQGWIVGELDSTDKTPREGNQQNFDWLKTHLKADEITQ
jgi:inosose dehydratase